MPCARATHGPLMSTALVVGALTVAAASSAAPAQTELHVPSDFTTIQAAIDAASSGDEIIIAPGVYNETIDIVSKSDITLRSAAGPEETILDGTDLGRTMLRVVEGATGIQIEGFTLRNSDPLGGTFLPGLGGNTGGAMLVFGDSEVAIHNCTFRDNVLNVEFSTWSNYGAALGISLGSSVTVSNSTFLNNRLTKDWILDAGAGISVVFGSSLTVTECMFHHNLIHGGGRAAAIFAQGTDEVTATFLHVSNSEFHKNAFDPEMPSGSGKGGAVALNHYAVAMITGCMFTENSRARGGAIDVTVSNLTVEDSEFHDNTATVGTGSRGGAISIHGSESDVNVTGCVFTDNLANFGGGAIYAFLASPSPPITLVTGSTFCQNGPNHIDGGAGWDDGGGNTFADICPEPVFGDLTGDGAVDVFDLLELLSAWGSCTGNCPADLDDNGIINVFDLLLLLAAWT